MSLTFTTDVERMRLTSSGNLGLGVTPSAWSYLTAFQVKNASIGGVVDNAYFSANCYFDGTNWRYIATNEANRIEMQNGNFEFYQAPSGTAGAAITFTQAMTLFANGGLGLNTTTPTTSTGYHTFSLNSSTGGQIEFQTAGAGKAFIYSNSTDLRFYTSGGAFRFENTTGLEVGYSAAQGLYKLDVNGTGRFAASYTASGTVAIETWQRSGGAVSADMTYNDANTSMNFGTSTSHTLNLKTNNTTALSIASTGAATFTGSITSTNSTGSISMVAAGSSDTKNSSGSFNIYDTTNNRGWGLQQDASYKLNFWHYNGGWTSVANISGTGAVTATSFFESSDSRLKTLIQDNYQTKGIASITPKLYTKNGKVELGYYAQDFVGILDSAVSKGSDDMLSLSYREVHTAKIYALEQEIKELKAKMN